MIDLAPESLAIVRRLLAALLPECKVRAFGIVLGEDRKTGIDPWRKMDHLASP